MEERGGELKGGAEDNGNVAHVHLVDVGLWRKQIDIRTEHAQLSCDLLSMLGCHVTY